MTIKLLDKEFVVACPDNERDALIDAARFLDRKLREVRDGGRVIGMERIAVITALNLANELLRDRRERDAAVESYGEGVRRMKDRLELFLRGDSGAQTV
jgi:cell division protein ZapA